MINKTTKRCPEKYWLTDSGWLNVSHDDGVGFCAEGGCAEHTRAVLLCIHHVKRDYSFTNHASVKDLNDTINNGCAQGFTGASLTSSGYRSKSAPIFGALSAAAAALLFIAFF
ncbi:UNVERIFIED_CONTAM: hypothetical protein Sangu_3167000 [Sesamum angustifolium]|uniref:DUF7731 domain-containing protein n=1 Tax=Sesamum angustifolium TaxID=2727405 RepID=A0AAW2JVM4_9LAMI